MVTALSSALTRMMDAGAVEDGDGDRDDDRPEELIQQRTERGRVVWQAHREAEHAADFEADEDADHDAERLHGQVEDAPARGEREPVDRVLRGTDDGEAGEHEHDS